jgi:hypothetical protein
MLKNYSVSVATITYNSLNDRGKGRELVERVLLVTRIVVGRNERFLATFFLQMTLYRILTFVEFMLLINNF